MEFVTIEKARKIRPPNKLEMLSDKISNQVSANLYSGVQRFKKNIKLDKIIEALEKGSPAHVVKEIPWNDSIHEILPSFNKIEQSFETAGMISYESLPIPIKDNLRTDLKNPVYKKFIADRFNKYMHDLNLESQLAVQRAIQRSFSHARRPAQVAKEIINHIGLNERQSIALMNYQVRLETMGIKPEKIDLLADQYGKRLLKQRSVMIARTEVANANNQGQLAVWQQAQNEGLLDATVTYKVWNNDRSPCDICIKMNGKKVKLNEKWRLPNGKLASVPSESHPNCITSGHKILTSKGLINIEDIKSGDEVWTHKNRWRKVINSFSNEYKGYLYTIRTKSSVIECTPEHPFRIENSWINASDLMEGNNAIKVNTVKIPFEKINSKPSTSFKVRKFFSICQSFFCRAVPTTSLNFHGDKRINYCDINIIRTYCHKWFNGNIISNKFINELIFKCRNFFTQLYCFRSFNQIFTTSFCPFNSSMSGHSHEIPFSSSKFAKSYFKAFTMCPTFKVCFFKPFSNSCPASIKYGCNIFKRFSTVINRSNFFNWNNFFYYHKTPYTHPIAIVSSNKEYYEGTVYNITVEEDHSYVVNDIVTHNCFCFQTLEL